MNIQQSLNRALSDVAHKKFFGKTVSELSLLKKAAYKEQDKKIKEIKEMDPKELEEMVKVSEFLDVNKPSELPSEFSTDWSQEVQTPEEKTAFTHMSQRISTKAAQKEELRKRKSIVVDAQGNNLEV